MKNSFLFYVIPAAALGIGAAGGWFTAPQARVVPAPITVDSASAPARSGNNLSTPATSHALGDPKQSPVDSSLETAMSYPSALHRRAAVKRYFESLDLASFNEVFTRVRKIGEAEPEVLDLFARVWAERAPESAARALLTLPAGPQRSRTLLAFARAWGRRDAAAASAWAEKTFAGQDLQQARSYLKNRGPQAAEKPKTFEEIMAIAGRDERQKELSTYLRKLAETDPEKALEQASGIQIQHDRRNAELAVTSLWSYRDPAGFLQWLKKVDSKKQWKGTEWTGWVNSLSTAASRLIDKDLNQVRQILDEWPDGQLKNSLATQYSSRLAYSDPEAALSFVEEMKFRNPDFSASNILPGLFEKAPEKGKELLKAEVERLQSKNASNAGEYTANLMKKWIEKDASDAAQFATSLPANAMPDVFYAISKEWCIKDGQAALKWATELPSSPAKEHALRQFTYTWSKHDTKKSTTWLSSLPRDNYRWAATEGFVCSTFDTDPDAALGWARSIPDEKQRLSIIARAWVNWEHSNSTSAWDWLGNGELSETERNAILKQQR
jgi:hypothetical protein